MAESLLNPQRVELSNNPVTLARHFGVFRSPTKLEINYFCFQSEFAAALPQKKESKAEEGRRGESHQSLSYWSFLNLISKSFIEYFECIYVMLCLRVPRLWRGSWPNATDEPCTSIQKSFADLPAKSFHITLIRRSPAVLVSPSSSVQSTFALPFLMISCSSAQ